MNTRKRPSSNTNYSSEKYSKDINRSSIKKYRDDEINPEKKIPSTQDTSRPFNKRTNKDYFDEKTKGARVGDSYSRTRLSNDFVKKAYSGRRDSREEGGPTFRKFEDRGRNTSFYKKKTERKNYFDGRNSNRKFFSEKNIDSPNSYSHPKGSFKEKFEKKSFRSIPDENFFSSKKAKEGYKQTMQDKFDNSIRLNAYISNSGLCSRRAADHYITNGEITVNGKVVTSLGTKISKGDTVKHNSKVLYPQDKVYILLNKPKGFATTVSDPHEKKTVMDLVKGACKERIYPIGRLDKDTVGVLLLTNDGDLAKKLSHPSSMIPKVYRVVLNKPIEREDLKKIREGLVLEDGPAPVDDIQVDKEDSRICGVEIHIGRNRIVRRIFENLGYEVLLLERNLYAGLTRTRVSRGEWRFLTSLEVSNLKRLVSRCNV